MTAWWSRVRARLGWALPLAAAGALITVSATGPTGAIAAGAGASREAVPPGSGWAEIRTADATTCGVRLDGSGWCWGDNSDGSVGDGTTTDRTRPVLLPGAWTSIQPGDTTCGVRSDGAGYCWGDNGAGQVGDGTTVRRLRPVRLAPDGWDSITSTAQLTCGVGVDGSGWCWGQNEFGRIGDGTTSNRAQPVRLPGSWSAIEPANLSTCGVGTDGSGWCWGYGTNGEVGNGQSDGFQTTPYRLPGQWTQISPTTYDTCGVRVNGSGWCWGANSHGQIGDGTRQTRTTPVRIPGRWSAISDAYYQLASGRGRNTTCGVRVDGSGWCWGGNDDGQLGTGDTAERTTPTQLPGSWSTLVQDGSIHDNPGSLTCGIRPDASAWCWGLGRAGALGTGSRHDQLTPAPVGVSLATLSLDGSQTVCGTSPDGVGYCWGTNDHGTLGDGTTRLRTRPTVVTVDDDS